MGNGALDLWRDPCDTVRIETDLGRQFQLARNRSGLGSPGPDTGSFRLLGGQLDMIAAFTFVFGMTASFFMSLMIVAIGLIMAFMLLITTVFVVVMAIFGLWGRPVCTRRIGGVIAASTKIQKRWRKQRRIE